FSSAMRTRALSTIWILSGLDKLNYLLFTDSRTGAPTELFPQCEPFLAARVHRSILKPESYERWLGLEHDPHDLLITYPSEPMTRWQISTGVNKPENDDAAILDRAAEPSDWQAPLDQRNSPG